MSEAKASPTRTMLIGADAIGDWQAEALARLREQQARDDERRAAGPRVRMICLAPFTLVDDAHPRGRVVERGEVLEVPAMDVEAYTGRCRLTGGGE